MRTEENKTLMTITSNIQLILVQKISEINTGPGDYSLKHISLVYSFLSFITKAESLLMALNYMKYIHVYLNKSLSLVIVMALRESIPPQTDATV